MLMLSDGEKLFLIYKGQTSILKDINLTKLEFTNDVNIKKHPVNIDISCHKPIQSFVEIECLYEDSEIINKEIDLKENWIKEMTIKEILDIFNNKVNQREVVN